MFVRHVFMCATTIIKIDCILELQKNDDWKGVLDHFSRPGDKYHDPMLVWIRPSIEAIKFIESELKRSIQYQFYLFLL